MARPGNLNEDRLTSREMALAGGLTPRNFALLVEYGLAPPAVDLGSGKGGHRTFDSDALAQSALIGVLNRGGMELLVAARLAQGFAENFRDSYGRMPSNLGAYLQAPLNPTPGRRPWRERPGEPAVDIEQDYGLHQRLRSLSGVYKSGEALRGDWIIDIADNRFVTTETLGFEAIKIHSPVSEGLAAHLEFRILGRGATARIVPPNLELDSLDVFHDPVAADQMRRLETAYMKGREHAVSRLRINLSLAIRNAYDNLQEMRAQRSRT